MQLAASADPVATSADVLSNFSMLRQRLLDSYLKLGQYAEAQALLDSVSPSQQSEPGLERVRLLLAAHAGRLPALLSTYTASPDTAPALDLLSAAASALADATSPDQPNARLLREYVFDQKQLANQLTPADFLALAQSLLATGDLTSAVELLQRLARQPAATATLTDANANTDSAAALLESTHHPAEAVPFLRALSTAAPWNATYRLRFARAVSTDAAALQTIARDPAAPYTVRAEAARALAAGAAPAGDLGSAELNVLASPHPSAASVRQPYYLASRLAAAQLSGPDQQTLLREAVSIAPDGIPADRARLSLLQLTLPDQDPSFALAVLRLLGQQVSQQAVNQTEPDDSSDVNAAADADSTSPGADSETSDPPSATLPPLAATLDLATRIHLAQQVAEAYTRDRDLDSALGYLLGAARLDQQSPHPDPALTAVIEKIRLARQLLAINAARRPVIQPELRRPINVRPRLTLAQLQAQEAP